MVGGTAKQIFDRARLPNDVLVRIWNLADTEQRGMLNVTEFIIAMHLLASYKSGALRALPQTLPPGLHDAAVRRGAPPRPVSGSRVPTDLPQASAIPRQFSGAVPHRTASPLSRPYVAPAMSAHPNGPTIQTGVAWAITPQEKARFDSIFAKVDTKENGFVNGEDAVRFFSNSKLPEDDLAQIWDLADINSEGKLNHDEFAVAMYLIQQQLAKRGPLPESLPQNLVPPIMRKQPIAPPQSTAPAFDNAASVSKPKSAIDDLFGLDAMAVPAPQVSQSTGNSTAIIPASPASTSLPMQTQQTAQSTVFKPFVPSSSFGQNMMVPQATGTSSTAASPVQSRGSQQPQRQPTITDDLLGDNDPEVSKKLTQETSELANLSNQVGTLTRQMQDVRSKRASMEQDLSQVNNQKRDFENRLSQLRSAYEQEARDVRSLEERLLTSKNDTKKVQQDLAMVQHTQQNLQEQRQQIASALDADQKENTDLKERMRQTNNEISQLKPQVEKVRSDARQQKGLVAINKKQLSTIEAERDKLKGELEAANKDLAEATKEAEGTSRSMDEVKIQLDGASKNLDGAKKQVEELKARAQAIPQSQTPAPAASPTSSTNNQSMNPFFRRTTTASSERGMSQSSFTPEAVTSPNHNAFDSFFGPAFGGVVAPEDNPLRSDAPTTSFGRELSDSSGGQTHSAEQAGLSGVPTTESLETPGSTSDPQERTPFPSSSELPPPPPQSRQITSSFLPLRENTEKFESPSSSVGVAAPASRFGDLSGSATPTHERQTSQSFASAEALASWKESAQGYPSSSLFPERKSSLPTSTPPADSTSHRPSAIGTSEANEGFRDVDNTSAAPHIPGSFVDSTPFHTPMNSAPQSEESSHQAGIEKAREIGQPKDLANSSNKDNFESLFSGFGSNGKAPEQNKRGISPDVFVPPNQPGSHGEFPPIQEFAADDSDSEYSDRGFDDHFAPTTPQRQQANLLHPSTPSSGPGDERTENSATEQSATAASEETEGRPPSPDAQRPPPTYNQSVPQAGSHRDSNQFPAEYGGLLPSREVPTASSPVNEDSETAVQSPAPAEGDSSIMSGFASFFGGNSAPNGGTGSGVLGGVTSMFSGGSGASAKERSFSGDSLPPSQMPMAPGSTAAPFAYSNETAAESQRKYSQSQPQSQQDPQPHPQSQLQPPIPLKNAFDDFDNEFGDLSEAQIADDHGDDQFTSSTRDGFDEFNPTFDSPAPSKGTNSSILQNSSAFHDFESSFSAPSQASSSRQAPPPAADHDWDAIFAGLDGNSLQANGNGLSTSAHQQPAILPKENFGHEDDVSVVSTSPPVKPTLARALTSGTEHDDPILKRLTGMGYLRQESLDALEKYDYNLDKVIAPWSIQLV